MNTNQQYYSNSLNTYPKRQEMLKVINENKRIAERIRCRKPNYSHTEWVWGKGRGIEEGYHGRYIILNGNVQYSSFGSGMKV